MLGEFEAPRKEIWIQWLNFLWLNEVLNIFNSVKGIAKPIQFLLKRNHDLETLIILCSPRFKS